MMKTVAFCIFLSLFYSLGSAQVISTEQVFPVTGYSVFEQGYPLMTARGALNQFVFLEFWAEGKEGRRVSNHYLQSYGIRGYVEHWYKPVTNEGFDAMEVTGLKRLQDCIAVIGHQYISEVKQVHTVARVFALDGTPKASEPIKISNYERKPKRGYKETVEISPKNKCMLWMGNTFSEHYVSVWDQYGKELWSKQLELPYVKEKFQVIETHVDDKGNAYFLMGGGTPNPLEDGAKSLLLVRYMHGADQFLTEMIPGEGDQNFVRSHFQLLENDDLFVAGVLSYPGAQGIKNGIKIGKTVDWTHFFAKRYTRSEEDKSQLEMVADSVSAIPSGWIDQYALEGTNFAFSELTVDKNYAALIMEERFTNKKRMYYYDVGCVGFDVRNGGMIWRQIIKKKQRDSSSDAFLSYVKGISRERLRMVYLSERGASGQLLCTSIDMATGKRKDKMLASNEAAEYLFFPARSGMVSNYEMVLIGRGNPSQNDFKLITIAF